MFRIKGGTVRVLVEAEHDAPAIEDPPLTLARVRKAAHFSLDRFGEGSDRYATRFLRLGLLLLCVYALSGAAYLITVMAAYNWMADPTWRLLGSMAAASASLLVGAWLTVVNLLYLLLQVLVVANDWPVRTAARALPGTARASAASDRRHLSGDAGAGGTRDGRLGAGNRRAWLHRLCPHRGAGRAAAAAAGLARPRPAVPVPGIGRSRRVRGGRSGGQALSRMSRRPEVPCFQYPLHILNRA